MKAVTFSYDDGITQDQRLIALFNRYGLKATFNLNSDLLGTGSGLLRENVTVAHVKPRREEISHIYEGHEVAVHTLTHPNLTRVTDDAEVIRQVEEDRKALSDLVGYEVVGMAYPCGGGNHDERVANLIREHTGICYARTITSTHSFDPQVDLLQFNPTVHHTEFEQMFRLAHEFIHANPNQPQIFYVWGHSFEFDIHNTWSQMEEFCKLISGRDDVFYGTNQEILLNDSWYRKKVMDR